MFLLGLVLLALAAWTCNTDWRMPIEQLQRCKNAISRYKQRTVAMKHTHAQTHIQQHSYMFAPVQIRPVVQVAQPKAMIELLRGVQPRIAHLSVGGVKTRTHVPMLAKWIHAPQHKEYKSPISSPSESRCNSRCAALACVNEQPDGS